MQLQQASTMFDDKKKKHFKSYLKNAETENVSLSTRPWDKLFHFPIMQLSWHILEGHKCSYWGPLHSSARKVCVCSDCWRLNESQHLLQSTDNTDCKLCYPIVFLCLFLYFLSQYANPSRIQSAWTEYILDDSKNLINGPKESPK